LDIMEKWRYKSLEWIHRIREDNHSMTKNLSPQELIEKTRNETDSTVRALGLKVIHKKTSIHKKA